MEYKFYMVEKKPPLAWVYLNRPEKKNAMNAPAWYELIPIMEDLDGDDQVRVIILAGKGTMFSSGIDLMGMIPELPELVEKEQKGGTKQSLYRKILRMQEGLSCIESCRKPVVAAVHGKCIGAGLDMITACDIRLCTEDAEFSLREAAVGITADMGVLQRLSNICGQGITRELAFTAKNITAKRAKEIHLVNETYAGQDELMKAAEQLARDIADNSPVAVKGTKIVLNQLVSAQVRENLAYNAILSAAILPNNDLFEAVTAFSQKRKPNFSGS